MKRREEEEDRELRRFGRSGKFLERVQALIFALPWLITFCVAFYPVRMAATGLNFENEVHRHSIIRNN